MLATIEGVSFIARTSVDSVKNLMAAKKAVEKAFRYQIEGKGFSFVEILSPCPTDWGMSAEGAINWMRSEMTPVFPLGTIKDKYGEL